MENPEKPYWQTRLAHLKTTLEANNFSVFLAADTEAAKGIFLDAILPETGAASVSWGGSKTAAATGLFDELKNRPDMEVVDAFEKGISLEESWKRRRRAFLVDLYLTGSNAVTDAGQLVNLDRTGNRVAATVFGPKHVVVFTGRNKIVATLADAMDRVKRFAAPINAMRLEMKTPCAKTAVCQDCSGTDRLCNAWAITEKSYPKGRIKVVLIDQDLGY